MDWLSLALQLVAAGEDIVDVPPTLAPRVGVLGCKSQKSIAANRNSRFSLTEIRAESVLRLRG